jgi:hypothetical protein
MTASYLRSESASVLVIWLGSDAPMLEEAVRSVGAVEVVCDDAKEREGPVDDDAKEKAAHLVCLKPPLHPLEPLHTHTHNLSFHSTSPSAP